LTPQAEETSLLCQLELTVVVNLTCQETIHVTVYFHYCPPKMYHKITCVLHAAQILMSYITLISEVLW
jgi:hypothetical protein